MVRQDKLYSCNCIIFAQTVKIQCHSILQNFMWSHIQILNFSEGKYEAHHMLQILQTNSKNTKHILRSSRCSHSWCFRPIICCFWMNFVFPIFIYTILIHRSLAKHLINLIICTNLFHMGHIIMHCNLWTM